MDSKWSPDCVPELARAEFVLPRKDLNPIDLPERSFDRHVQTQREIIYIDPAQFRRQWFLAENPKVRTSARHLHDRVNAILLEFPLQCPQVAVRAFVIGIDRHPL